MPYLGVLYVSDEKGLAAKRIGDRSCDWCKSDIELGQHYVGVMSWNSAGNRRDKHYHLRTDSGLVACFILYLESKLRIDRAFTEDGGPT